MSNTTNLNLFKHDNPSTNTNPFDIEASLNENWDKIDAYAGNTNTAITTNENNIEALQQENARLKATLPTTSETGENITLNKTAELDFVVPPLPIGNTVQDGEPTPTNPVEVQVVKGDVEVKVENINILNPYAMFENQINSGLIQIQSDGKIILNGTVDYNNRTLKKTKLKAGTYHSIEEQRIVHFFWDNYDGHLKRDTYTLTEDKEISGYLQNGTYDNVELQPMIYTGAYDANKSYTPHKEQTLPLTLGNIELCKIGDYQDYFYKSGSKWYLHKEIGKVVLDGDNEDWRFTASYSNNTRFSSDTSKTLLGINSKLITNYFIEGEGGTDTTNIDTNGKTGHIMITIPNSIANTLDSFENWLSNNNVIVYYSLENSTDTEITDTTLINQLEAIYNAISYYEQTNISGTSSGINPLFDVEAYQNTKLLLEDIINSN